MPDDLTPSVPDYCQSILPIAPWAASATRRLPGIQPFGEKTPFLVDDAFAGQMAERDRLVAPRPDAVCADLPEAADALAELDRMVLAALQARPDYQIGDGFIRRPDGATVPTAGPVTHRLARLVQEDLLILEGQGGAAARLLAATLCFPASWTLAEKIGRSMLRIHAPVDRYADDMARRVGRLFDALHPDRPLWRANYHLYGAPDLFAPRREGQDRPVPAAGPHFIRVERQTLHRLPETGAILFGIHTFMVPVHSLTEDQREGLRPFWREDAGSVWLSTEPA
ncbi:heme-dependent oxidative N-demethylase family protein [Oceanomicrobium pacificus]|uniref:DUF3445 domain-containing protein n=1 Tax=Oceanomicrobium pacificus TaxID=2692916 RepID=A0A6B0TPH1_9RHOB|nr:DUF3445 domain-containing protein [Oceanomicrobium pacificus]MXU65806.1 DUF3445 domain-containing protein [Oceanomicrobium pacificus]